MHRPSPSAGGRGQSREAGNRVQGTAVGGGAHAQLDASLPACSDPLGQDSAELCGVAAFGMCLYYIQTIWPTGIGSKAVAYTWAACMAADLSERLRAIHAPSLVIAGLNDLFTPPYLARAVTDGLSEVELEKWEE